MPETSEGSHDHEQYPEVVVPPSSNFRVHDSSYEYYLPQDAPAPELVPLETPETAPAPQYQPYPGRPISSPSPQFISHPDQAYSDSTSDNRWQTITPPARYSDFQTLDSGRVCSLPPFHPSPDEKEYYNKNGITGTIVPDVKDTDAIPRKPLLMSQPTPAFQRQRRKPLYRRRGFIIAGLVLLAIIVAGAVAGAVVGTRKHNQAPDDNDKINGDPDLAVGGWLNSNWYSTTGAFNGSGIAIAAANPEVDQTAYIFYQDFGGQISWKLMRSDGSFSQPLGTINDQSSTPLNGTPLSVVNTQSTPGQMAYHLFYIDDSFTLIERILETGVVNSGSIVPVWEDGPLIAHNITTLNSTSIGMQACFADDFYGDWDNNDHNATDSIILWFATTEQQFAEWYWVNGTSDWAFQQNWDGLDGHAGVGCQTWESWMLQYVFFVDLDQNIAMYWRDNNQSAPSTSSHPTLQWEKIDNFSISSVHKSSSLGYTNYMVYQDENNVIRGANISWAAENTTIAVTDDGTPDIFEIDDFKTHQAVAAVRGTHLTITALRTASGGAELQVFFQQDGDDISQYTRDNSNVDGLWQPGASAV